MCCRVRMRRQSADEEAGALGMADSSSHICSGGWYTGHVWEGIWWGSWKWQLNRQGPTQAMEKRMDTKMSQITSMQLWNTTQDFWVFLGQYCPPEDSGCLLGWACHTHSLSGRQGLGTNLTVEYSSPEPLGFGQAHFHGYHTEVCWVSGRSQETGVLYHYRDSWSHRKVPPSSSQHCSRGCSSLSGHLLILNALYPHSGSTAAAPGSDT